MSKTKNMENIVSEDMKMDALEAFTNETRISLNSQLTGYNPELDMAKSGNDVVVYKTYNFVNPLGKKSELKIFDRDVIISLEKIGQAIKVDTASKYIICKELAKLDDKEILDRYGFSSIGQLGHSIFGYKSNTANQYARIGKLFLTDDYMPIPELPTMSVNHYLELLVLAEGEDITNIKRLYLEGVLTDGLSTKKLREKIKFYREKSDAIETTGKVVQELPADTKTSKTDKKEEKQAETNNTTNSEELPADTTIGFDLQVEVGKILNNLVEVINGFANIESQGIQITGVSEKVEELLDYAKSLIK